MINMVKLVRATPLLRRAKRIFSEKILSLTLTLTLTWHHETRYSLIEG